MRYINELDAVDNGHNNMVNKEHRNKETADALSRYKNKSGYSEALPIVRSGDGYLDLDQEDIGIQL
jgi:hypothetical protein